MIVQSVHLIDIKSLVICGQLYERVPHILVTPCVPSLRGSSAALAEKEVWVTTMGLDINIKTPTLNFNISYMYVCTLYMYTYMYAEIHTLPGNF